MGRARARQREMALERVEILLDEALKSARDDLEMARRQAQIARRLCLRFNLRLPYPRRQLLCHGCKALIIPGINARVRLSKKRRSIAVTCMHCGFIYRKIIDGRGED